MANIRKNIGKTKKNENAKNLDNSINIKFCLIVCAIMLILAYGVSALLYHFNKEPSTIVDVKQYNINASLAFNMPEEEYYVAFYDKDGVDAIVLNALIDKYRKSGDGVVYVVDLSKDYNKSIISDVPNSSATNSSELKVSGSTLLKISGGKNVGYFESILLIEKELK